MNFLPAAVERRPAATAVPQPSRCRAEVAERIGDRDAAHRRHPAGALRGRRPGRRATSATRGQRSSAEVDVTEWLGNEQYAYIPYEAPEDVAEQLADLERELDSEQLRTQLVVALDPTSRIRDGETPTLWLDPSRMHLFDPAHRREPHPRGRRRSGRRRRRGRQTGRPTTTDAATDPSGDRVPPPDLRLRVTVAGAARAAVAGTARRVGRHRGAAARHPGRPEPPPGAVRRDRRRAVGAQGAPAAHRREGVRGPARPGGPVAAGGAAGRPGRPAARGHRDPRHPLPRTVLAVPAAAHAHAAGRSPRTASGCSTRWPACWSTCTATASSGATARWPTRCSRATARSCRRGWSTPRPARSTRGSATGSASTTSTSWWRTSPAAWSTSPCGWSSRPRCIDAARRRGGQRRHPLPGAVGRAARRADVPVRRPVPDRGPDPAPARPRLRRRRGQPAVHRRRARARCGSRSPSPPAGSTPPSCTT